MPKLAIGLWTFDAGDLFGDGNGNRWTKSVSERIKGLDTAAGKVHAAASLKAGAASFDSILAAPEYLFSGRDQDGKRLPMAEMQRLQLEQELLGLSRKYPRMLMFPGTLFYCKDLIRPDKANLKFEEKTGLREKQKQTRADRRDRYGAKVNLVMQQATRTFEDEEERKQVLLTGATRGEMEVFHSPSLATIASTLINKSKNPKVVRNAAYVLLGGRRIAKYDKSADFAETRGASADDLAFLPGTVKQCPEIDGYRLGVEICYDHQIGVLSRRNVHDLRFHVLLSDATKVKQECMAMMKGGYFLHASTASDATGVWSRNKDGLIDEIKGKDQGNILSCEELQLYEVTLN